MIYPFLDNLDHIAICHNRLIYDELLQTVTEKTLCSEWPGCFRASVCCGVTNAVGKILWRLWVNS
jgi:hypothetical protein